MNLNHRLKRLEALLGMGQPCTSCRLFRRDSLATLTATPPPDSLASTCSECGLISYRSLAGLSAREREAQLLLEAYPAAAVYTDAKAHALHYWITFRPARVARQHQQQARHAARQVAAPRAKAVKLYAELFAAGARQYRAEEQKMLARYGQRFPEQDALVNDLLERNGPDPAVTARATLERIIWGEPLPETVTALARIEAEKVERLAAVARQAWRREEELLARNRRILAQPQEQPWGY